MAKFNPFPLAVNISGDLKLTVGGGRRTMDTIPDNAPYRQELLATASSSGDNGANALLGAALGTSAMQGGF